MGSRDQTRGVANIATGRGGDHSVTRFVYLGERSKEGTVLELRVRRMGFNRLIPLGKEEQGGIKVNCAWIRWGGAKRRK